MNAMMMCAGVCVLLGLILPESALADADSARSKGAAWLIQQQRGDGSWSNTNSALNIQATSAALLALKNAGLSMSPTFGSAASWLANADADSIDAIARKTEGLAAAGLTSSAQSESDRLYALRALSVAATWGGYGGSGVDHLDSALGLMGLRVGDSGYLTKANAPSNNTITTAVCNLIASRISIASGKQAWPAVKATVNQSSAQGRPSVVATALLMHELRSMQLRSGFPSFTCDGVDVPTVLNEAQAWLLDQQNADGGFGEQRTDGNKGASNVLVTVWVYRALNAMGSVAQPQTGSAQAWLLAQQDASSGAWRDDPLVTASVVAALPAATGAQLTDTDQDGVSDVVETQLGSNPALADARNQLDTPSLSVPGYTATSFALSATVGQTFSHSLGAAGSYTLTAGSLPPGLTLHPTTGRISGTPSQAGSYSFDYETGSGSTAQLVIGRIDVAEMAQQGGDGDVPLPGWALLALGATLLGVIRRSCRPA